MPDSGFARAALGGAQVYLYHIACCHLTALRWLKVAISISNSTAHRSSSLFCYVLSSTAARLLGINDFSEAERIPLLFEKIGSSDSFYMRRSSFLRLGIDDLPSPRTSSTLSSKPTESTISPMDIYIFNAILNEFVFRCSSDGLLSQELLLGQVIPMR